VDGDGQSQGAALRAVDAGRALEEARDNADIPRCGWDRWVERKIGLPKTTAYYRQAIHCSGHRFVQR
jgi:hypothetical protein